MLIRWVAVALILLTAGCGGSNKSRSAKTGGDEEGGNLSSLIDEEADKEDKDVIARRQCLGDNRKPKECLGDDDCCQGFYCGKDPEVSPRVKVCIDSGQ
jgi:hypothetical protein